MFDGLTTRQLRLLRYAAGFLLGNAIAEDEVDVEAAQEMDPERRDIDRLGQDPKPLTCVKDIEEVEKILAAAVEARKAVTA